MFNLLLTATLVFVQQPGTITGTIVEARTGAPLAAVLVKVQSTGQQAFSDADGTFAIRTYRPDRKRCSCRWSATDSCAAT